MVNLEHTPHRPDPKIVRMAADPESTLTQEEILDRFRRLFGRDMTPPERRGFFLPEPTEQTTNLDKPQ
jgi:hypothetical protein